MKKYIMVLGILVSVVFNSCEKESLDEEPNKEEIQLIDKGEIGEPDDEDPNA